MVAMTDHQTRVDPKWDDMLDCPVCGAPAGFPCNADAEGEFLEQPHPERSMSAVE